MEAEATEAAVAGVEAEEVVVQATGAAQEVVAGMFRASRLRRELRAEFVIRRRIGRRIVRRETRINIYIYCSASVCG